MLFYFVTPTFKYSEYNNMSGVILLPTSIQSHNTTKYSMKKWLHLFKYSIITINVFIVQIHKKELTPRPPFQNQSISNVYGSR